MADTAEQRLRNLGGGAVRSAALGWASYSRLRRRLSGCRRFRLFERSRRPLNLTAAIARWRGICSKSARIASPASRRRCGMDSTPTF